MGKSSHKYHTQIVTFKKPRQGPLILLLCQSSFASVFPITGWLTDGSAFAILWDSEERGRFEFRASIIEAWSGPEAAFSRCALTYDFGDDCPVPDSHHKCTRLLDIPNNDLVALFNLCVSEGAIPSQWMVTLLVGIQKKGKPADNPKSYRIIA